MLFHPDHIVPASKLITALAEGAAETIPHPFMETGAGMGQVFVLPVSPGDAGISVQEMAALQFFLQRGIQCPAKSFSMGVLTQIDRGFHRPVVGGAGFKRTCIT